MRNKKLRPFSGWSGGRAKTDARALQALKSIDDESTRNLVRGILSNAKNRILPRGGANQLRRAASRADLAKCATILLGKAGAFPFSNQKGNWRSLLRSHDLAPIGPSSEAAYSVGHLNGWLEDCLLAVDSILSLAELPSADPRDALGALHKFAERWGASNFLAKKIAFVMARHGDHIDLSEQFNALTAAVEPNSHPVAYFTALEAIDPAFGYLSGVNTRVQAYARYVKENDFRQLLPLHNIAAGPVSYSDVGGFLRKAHSMSFIDQLLSIGHVRSICAEWNDVSGAIAELLDPSILSKLDELSQHAFDATRLFDYATESDADQIYYRSALAFTEFAAPANFRNYVDRVLAPRLLRDFVEDPVTFSASPIPARRDLTKALRGFAGPMDYLDFQRVGRFLRTVHFLLFADATELHDPLDQHEIRFIFEHTIALDILLSEREIERLYLVADADSRPFITTLAMALYKSRSADEDIDFKFRKSLCDTIIDRFNGDIVAFVKWLIPSTPEIAHFVVATLDRPTLQKLYWIVRTPDEADRVRQDILRAVGQQRQKIEYLVEADAIEAQRRVAKLGRYFDESRMYVDSIAMKKSLHDNPSVYARQYVRLIEHSVETVAAQTAVVKDGRIQVTGSTALPMATAFDYILKAAAAEAFTQFCKDEDFGIESYLSRRIRHNTLAGMMRSDVESLIDQPRHTVVTFDRRFVAANATWIELYRGFVERLRRDYLQFRTDQKPRGILSATLDEQDPHTKTNLAQLSKLAMAAGRDLDLFDELLIRFCWIQIDPQLRAAALSLSGEFATEVVGTIDEVLGSFEGQAWDQYRADLRQLVHEKFARLAGWFRQPDTAFVAATPREIGDLIYLESSANAVLGKAITWKGEHVDVAIDGLSVHRLYDCLSVLLQNAIRHGDDSDIAVTVTGETRVENRVARLRVEVQSTLVGTTEVRREHGEKLKAAFADRNIAASMVAEGYSGIRKLRFIVRAAGSDESAAGFVLGESAVSIYFGFDVELAGARP